MTCHFSLAIYLLSTLISTTISWKTTMPYDFIISLNLLSLCTQNLDAEKKNRKSNKINDLLTQNGEMALNAKRKNEGVCVCVSIIVRSRTHEQTCLSGKRHCCRRSTACQERTSAIVFYNNNKLVIFVLFICVFKLNRWEKFRIQTSNHKWYTGFLALNINCFRDIKH